MSNCSLNNLSLTIFRTGIGQVGVHEQPYSCLKSVGLIPVLRSDVWTPLHGKKETVQDKVHHDGVQLVSSRLQR